MQTGLEVLSRGVVMLVATTLLGLGPASFLGPRFTGAARLAIAPALGVCLGMSVFTTLVWFLPASTTYWLLPPLGLASVAVAIRRLPLGLASVAVAIRSLPLGHAGARLPARVGAAWRRLGVRDPLLLVALCLVVAAVPASVMVTRHSVGPIGYRIWDANGYVASTDGEQQQALSTSVHTARPPFANLEEAEWVGYARGYQNLDATPLSANLNELLGLHATDTQGVFLIALLIIGALGAFGSVRYLAPKPTWVAGLAGALFAGPFFLQLIIDGSEAAICGLGLLLPLTVVGLDALRDPRPATLAIAGLLAGGLLAAYPLFVPPVAVGAAVVLLIVGARRRRSLSPRLLGLAAGRIAGVLALAALLNLVSFTRDLRYWASILDGTLPYTGLPPYILPPGVLPEWLLQTAVFYRLNGLGSSVGGPGLLLGVLLPAILVGVVAFGLRHLRLAAAVVPVILVCAGLAYYAVHATHCSYCEDRDLLPAAPLTAFLLALGVAALVTSVTRAARLFGMLVAVGTIAVAGVLAWQERLALANGGYLLDSRTSTVLDHLPQTTGRVELEGFGAVPIEAFGELPMTYDLVQERTRGHASILSTLDDYKGLASLGGARATLGPEFSPTYEYVLTRAWGVQTSRQLIAQAGPVALERRAGPLDVTVATGLFLSPASLDTTGSAWVIGPLTFVVAGGTTSRPAWVSLGFVTTVLTRVTTPNSQRSRTTPSGHGAFRVCIRATGAAPVRYARVDLAFAAVPPTLAKGPYGRQLPYTEARLTSMRVAETPCPGG